MQYRGPPAAAASARKMPMLRIDYHFWKGKAEMRRVCGAFFITGILRQARPATTGGLCYLKVLNAVV
jgi:hypothetical protein